jgi:hypothetical protein
MTSTLAVKNPRAPRPFSAAEDAALISLVQADPDVPWDRVSRSMPGRSPRQCRERYINYLSPTIRTGPWTATEDQLLVEKVNQLGHFWATIGQFFGGRTESDVKNRWYSHLKFRVTQDGPGGAWRLVENDKDSQSLRKKRKRAHPSPKLNAERLLRESRFPRAGEVTDEPDSMILWELADDKVDLFGPGGLYDRLF